MAEPELLKRLKKVQQHDHLMIYATEDGMNYKIGVKLKDVETVCISLEENSLIIVSHALDKPSLFKGVYEVQFNKGSM